jgi:transposase-like protein
VPSGSRARVSSAVLSDRARAQALGAELLGLDVPRDGNGTLSPQIVRKGQTRLDGFSGRIVALRAWGMITRDIRVHLREMYDIDVSPDLISRLTDTVVEYLQEWQSRPLDRVYPVISVDCGQDPRGRGRDPP